MIDLMNIVKIYRSGEIEFKALDDISLQIKEGEFVAVCGPSGSGKTTLMQIIGCIDFPDSGEYYLEEENVLLHSENKLAEIRNRKIGFVFQKFNLLPKFDALMNVQLPLLYRGEDKEAAGIKAEETLKLVGLLDRKNHLPNQMSGGQQQRVAIARALVGDPPIILADEPTGNLDSVSGQEIIDVFIDLNKMGKTVVMITHDPEIAGRAGRIIFLRDGRVINT